MAMIRLSDGTILSSSSEHTDIFDHNFDNFERNRMYPLGYTKEPVMAKINMNHYSALCHAKLSMTKEFEPGMKLQYRKAIEDDILLIDDLRRFVLNYVFAPELPNGPTNNNPKHTP
jgi:hypothetical protein